MGINHEAVELRPTLTGTTDAFVNVFGYDLPASPSAILPKLGQLHLRVLVVHGADAGIQSDPHASPSTTPYEKGGHADWAGKQISSECTRLASQLNITSHMTHFLSGG